MSEVTKDLSESKPGKIVWKAIQPHHVARAAEIKKGSKLFYLDYLVSLVQTFDGQPVAPANATLGEIPPGGILLDKKQMEQVFNAFEAEYILSKSEGHGGEK